MSKCLCWTTPLMALISLSHYRSFKSLVCRSGEPDTPPPLGLPYCYPPSCVVLVFVFSRPPPTPLHEDWPLLGYSLLKAC